MHILSRFTPLVFGAAFFFAAVGPVGAQTVSAVNGAADFDSGMAVGPDGLIYVASEYRGIRSFNDAGVPVYTGPANNVDARQLAFDGAPIGTAALYVGGVNRLLAGVQRGGVYQYPAGCAATPDAGGCAAERITVAAPDATPAHTHYGVAVTATDVFATSDGGKIYRFPRATCTGATPCALAPYEIAAPGGSLGALQIIGGTLYIAASNAILSLSTACVAPCAVSTLAGVPGQSFRGLAPDGTGGLFAAASNSKTIYRIRLDGSVVSYVTDANFQTPANLALTAQRELYLADFQAGGQFWRITPPPVPVPTLDEWAMIGLLGLLALLGATRLQRRAAFGT